MPLFGKTLQEITTQSLEDLSQFTNLTRLGAGGKARAILDAVSKRLEEAYDTFDLNLARAFLSSAPGQYLDLIGELLGEPRLPSVTASIADDLQSFKWYVASGTFGDINGSSDINISRGTLISTEADTAGTIFRLAADVTCSAGSNAAWATVEATIPGEGGNIGSNTLKYHNFNGYTDYLNSTLLCTNVFQVGNGRGFENDDNYRYRLSKKVLSSEAANETAIRLAALSVPGVADVVIVKYYRGIGSFGVIIKSVVPTVSQGLIDTVTDRVLKAEALGVLNYIRGPRELGLTLKLNIYFDRELTEDDYATVENSLDDVIQSTVNALDIGETLYLGRLISSLFTVNSHIVAIGEQNKQAAESYIYKPTRLDDNKIRQTLLGDYAPASDERIIIEPSVAVPVAFTRNVKKVS
jgi:uncharacterized phage protein gp47/JayE